MKAGHKFLVGAGIIVASVVLLITQGVRETGVYFLTPSELAAKTSADSSFYDDGLKMGAKVVPGSVLVALEGDLGGVVAREPEARADQRAQQQLASVGSGGHVREYTYSFSTAPLVIQVRTSAISASLSAPMPVSGLYGIGFPTIDSSPMSLR